MPRRTPSVSTWQPFQVHVLHSRAETQLPFGQICLEIKCLVYITLFILTLNIRHQCRCKEGFALRGGECKAMDCPALLPPAHGYFLRNECKNVFNAACGVRCHSGYQVGLGVSLTYFKPYFSSLALASDSAYLLVHGVESPPSARLKRVGQCNRPPTAMSPAPHTTMKLTPPASLGRQGFYSKAFPLSRCNFGYRLLGSRKRLCLPISLWGGLPAYCKREFLSPLPNLFPQRSSVPD